MWGCGLRGQSSEPRDSFAPPLSSRQPPRLVPPAHWGLHSSLFSLTSQPAGLWEAPPAALREPAPLAFPRCPTGPRGAMVPSPAKPGAAALETSETESLGPTPVGATPLPGLGPSDVPEAAAEKVQVELVESAGAEPPQPPEGGWGWLVMLAAMWCNGSVFGVQNACGVLFVSMLKTFGSKDDDQMVFKTGEAKRPPRQPRGTGRHGPFLSASSVGSVCPRPRVLLVGSLCAGGCEMGVQLQTQPAAPGAS